MDRYAGYNEIDESIDKMNDNQKAFALWRLLECYSMSIKTDKVKENNIHDYLINKMIDEHTRYIEELKQVIYFTAFT